MRAAHNEWRQSMSAEFPGAVALTHLAEPLLKPDFARLVIRSFVPAAERVLAVIARVAILSEACIKQELDEVIGEFSADHEDLVERLQGHYAMAINLLGAGNEPKKLSPEAKLLLGAYFTSEYAFEATALFNPSIILAPQDAKTAVCGNTAPENLRFIMSARSVGEGHVSSISFRTGEIDHSGAVRVDPALPIAALGTSQLGEGGAEIVFRPETPLSGRLLFPLLPEEQNGMEDARFVRFINDDGTIR
jgi:hypothetical protein